MPFEPYMSAPGRSGEENPSMLKRRTIVLAISAFVGLGIAMHERPAAGHAVNASTPVAWHER
jgi:hypothetical protein